MTISKSFKFLIMIILGVALVFTIGSHLAPSRPVDSPNTPNTIAATELAHYMHVPTVATIDRRQVVRGPEGASLITWSTDASGAKWIDSINLTTNN